MQSESALKIQVSGRKRSLTAPLPPLVLFAALALVLGELLGAPADLPALLCGAAAAAALSLCRDVRGLAASAAVLVCTGTALVLIPAARVGAMTLANRLFAASEAANAYAYYRFDVPELPDAALRLALVLAALALGALCSLARLRTVVVAIFLAAAFLEAYFGVVPAWQRNALLFAVLAILLARGDEDLHASAALLAAAGAAALVVLTLAPQPIPAVEAYSEHLRDELAASAMNAAQSPVPPESKTEQARQESRLREEEAELENTETAREFERQTENERELSLPKRIDYLRIALLLLLAAALLIVPFLPFLFFNRARRRTEERRAAFADADNASAIRAMFAHTVDWLRRSGLDTANRPFASCADSVEALVGTAYAERFAETARIWEEAAYSRHTMTDAQRDAVRGFLDATAELLYGKADRRTRFRMKYVDCLCGSKQ